MPEITRYISASADDAYQTGSSVNLTGSFLRLSSSTHHWGLRFVDIDVPKDSTIDYAYLSMYLANNSYDTVSCTLDAEAGDDAATFTTASNDITSRTGTTPAISISITDVMTGGEGLYQIADAAAAIEDVVARAGWVSGNAVVLRLSGYVSGDLRTRTYDAAPEQAARLVIGYTPPSTTYQATAETGFDLSGTAAKRARFPVAAAGEIGVAVMPSRSALLVAAASDGVGVSAAGDKQASLLAALLSGYALDDGALTQGHMMGSATEIADVLSSVIALGTYRAGAFGTAGMGAGIAVRGVRQAQASSDASLAAALSLAAAMAASATDGLVTLAATVGQITSQLFTAAAADGFDLNDTPTRQVLAIAAVSEALGIAPDLAASLVAYATSQSGMTWQADAATVAALRAEAPGLLALFDTATGALLAQLIEALATDEAALQAEAGTSAVLRVLLAEGLVTHVDLATAVLCSLTGLVGIGDRPLTLMRGLALDAVAVAGDDEAAARFLVETADQAAFAAALGMLARFGAVLQEGLLIDERAYHILIGDRVTVTFTTRQGKIVFEVKQPGIDYGVTQPGVQFDIDG